MSLFLLFSRWVFPSSPLTTSSSLSLVFKPFSFLCLLLSHPVSILPSSLSFLRSVLLLFMFCYVVYSFYHIQFLFSSYTCFSFLIKLPISSPHQSAPTEAPRGGERLDAQHSVLPLVRFSCRGRSEGYYGDMDFGCTVFHYCTDEAQRFSFKCDEGMKFNEVSRRRRREVRKGVEISVRPQSASPSVGYSVSQTVSQVFSFQSVSSQVLNTHPVHQIIIQSAG